jgi:flagellar hook-basal body complex protein FliE
MKEIAIQQLQGMEALSPAQKTPAAGAAAGFGEALSQAIDQVNSLHHTANQSVEQLATGENQDIHRTMIALEKADVSFKLMMQVRNKVVSAYEEIMRMQV